MAQQTALQKLISEIEFCYDLMEEEHTQTKTLKWVVQQIKNRYLEMERGIIIDAYNQGYRDGEQTDWLSKDGKDVADFEDAETYLKLTFNNQ